MAGRRESAVGAQASPAQIIGETAKATTHQREYLAGRAVHVIFAAMLGNFCIAVAKFTAAFFSGSSAMVSEGIHSVVDTANQALLLVGDRRSRKPPDSHHPFGYGRELYFWSLVVAIVLFGIGGGLSAYEGLTHLHRPASGDPMWNYAVLGVAFVAESASLSVALREFRRRWGKTPLWKAFRASKDPRIFVPLAEDIAALIGLCVAVLGLFLAEHYSMPIFDPISSVIIGLILGAVAVVLVIETRELLVGEPADERILKRIRSAAEGDSMVLEVRQALTIHTSPEQIVLNLAVFLSRDLSLDETMAAIDGIKKRVRAVEPRLSQVFVEIGWLERDEPSA